MIFWAAVVFIGFAFLAYHGFCFYLSIWKRFFPRFRKYRERKKTLNIWKNEKRKKWNAEGMVEKDIERKLKCHKVLWRKK